MCARKVSSPLHRCLILALALALVLAPAGGVAAGQTAPPDPAALKAALFAADPGLPLPARSETGRIIEGVARSETGRSIEGVARSETGRIIEGVARSETGRSIEGVARSETGRSIEGVARSETGQSTDGTGQSTDGTGQSTDGTGQSTDGTGQSTDGTGRSIEGAALLPAAGPAGVADASVIVFQSYRDNNWEIYRTDGAGNGPVRLTNHGASDTRPRLNRDAAKVVFVSYRNNNAEIYTMNADGSDTRRLTDRSLSDSYPAWSPDGTRIVYSYYKDNESTYDLYVMNADGGGQRRLTTGADADVYPAWSPDGQQIAWIAASGSTQRIMLMNADGSNKRALTGALSYAQDVQWSPDGSQLALDYDADGDNWNELVVMAADGSGRRVVFDANQDMVDVWMGSWSPDGQSLLFSVVAYVEYQGNLYYDVAVIARVPAAGGTAIALPGSGMEMTPDWQKTDWLLPTSSMAPLPAVSPAAIALSWSGADVGPAGIANFDVQVRDGPSGAWADLLMTTATTSADFHGAGGHTYYFRARARDAVGNVEAWPDGYDAATTVEALPPASAVEALPAHMGNGGMVRWHGADPGGSGIRSYDVQHRELPDGAWTDWLTGVRTTSAAFTGTIGHTYAFRVRATDNASNVETWHAAAGDTTTLAAWAASGAVRTNRARPVADAAATLRPTGEQVVSLANGAYNLYSLAEPQTTYSVTWAHACFGDLPAAHFSDITDVRADAVLPPVDDVIQDGDFEAAALAPAWQASGVVLPVLSAEAVHTGAAGVRLGSRPFSAVQVVDAVNLDLPRLAIALDSRGTLHALWQGGTLWPSDPGGMWYARQPPGGDWTAPYRVASDQWVSDPAIVVDGQDNVHMMWRGSGVYYIRRSAAGAWSPEEKIRAGVASFELAADQRGVVHVLMRNESLSGSSESWYVQRGPAGAWTEPESLPAISVWSRYSMGVGPDGIVHACKFSTQGDVPAVFCARRAVSGAWTTSLFVIPQVGSSASRVLVGPDDVVHVLLWGYNEYGDDELRYARGDPSGAWSISVLATPPAIAQPIMVLEGSSSVHIAWPEAPSRFAAASLYHIVKRGTAQWTQPELIADNVSTWTRSYTGEAFGLAVDDSGAVHAAWRADGQPGGTFYARQAAGSFWEDPILMLGTTDVGYPDHPWLAVSAQLGTAHVVWPQGAPSLFPASILHATSAGKGDSRLAQTVTIPVSQAGSTLSFMYRLNGASADNTLAVQVVDGSTTITLFSAVTDARDWTHRWFDLAPWAGKTVTLAFTLHQTAGAPAAWADLDEVTVGSGLFADVWAHQLSQVVEPGEPITYTIRYGNTGGVLAAGVRVSTTLPAALTLLAAEPLPSATDGQTLTWNVGDRPAGSRGEITLSAQVAAGAAPHSVLRGSLSIAPAACEVEIANNTAAPAFFVSGSRAWLPLIRR